MQIQTAKCKICGTVVAADFLSTHIRFTHPQTFGRTDSTQKQPPLNKKLRTKKNNNPKTSTVIKQKNISNKKHDHSKSKSRKSRGGVNCILCGEFVPKGFLLEHKEKIHGESRQSMKSSTRASKSVWVSIVQGGLPSLGKRSR